MKKFQMMVLSRIRMTVFAVLLLAGSIRADAQNQRPPSANPAQVVPGAQIPDLNAARTQAARPVAPKNPAIRLAEFGHQVRMGTQMDLLATLQTYGTPEFMEAWQKNIAPYFAGQDRQWQDFFRNAVVFGGRLSGLKGVVIYYNPWSDTAMTLGVDLQEEVVTEFFVMAGERLRGEPVNERSVKPSWYASTSRLKDALGKIYVATEQSINSLYPLQAPYQMLPDALRQRLSSQQAELAPVKARMIDRMAMLDQLSRAAAGSPHALAQRNLNALAIHLQRSDRAAFEKLTSNLQDEQWTEVLFDWPERNRMRLGTAYYRQDEKGAIAALVSPLSPAWFVEVRLLDTPQGQRQIGNVTLSNLDIAKDLQGKDPARKQ